MKNYSSERYAGLFSLTPEGEKVTEPETTTPWRERLGHRAVGVYRTKRISAGDYLEYEMFPLWPNKETAKRARKAEQTAEAQVKLNQRNAVKAMIRKINANFGPGDLFLTLTYKGRQPDTVEEARKDIQAFLRRVRRFRRRKGLDELKYVYTLETMGIDGRKKRVHHHIIMSGMDRDEAERLWDLGRANSHRLQPDEFGLEALARYIAKMPAGSKRWCCSKKLKTPRVTYSDRKLCRRDAERAAADPESLREKLAKLEPDYLINDIEVRYSEWVPGAYVTVRMRRIGKPVPLVVQQAAKAMAEDPPGKVTKGDRPQVRARA